MTKTSKTTKKFRFSFIDWLCVAVGIAASIMTLFFDHNHTPLYLFISIVTLNCGIFETIFLVNGRRSTYLFAIANATTSVFIALTDHFYGNMAVNLYYIPLSIAGFYLWSKHSDQNKNVIARKLSAKQMIISAAAFVILSGGLTIILEILGGQSTTLDGITTIMVIFASILGILRYREQWLIWIVTDVLLLFMFISVNNPAIITMRIFFIISSVYGYINWKKLISKDKTTNKNNKRRHV